MARRLGTKKSAAHGSALHGTLHPTATAPQPNAGGGPEPWGSGPCRLVHRIAQGLARLEGHGVAGFDLDRGAGLRVLAGTGTAMALEEGTEANQGNAVLAVQRTGDFFEYGVEYAIGLILGQISLLGNCRSEFRFAHRCLFDGLLLLCPCCPSRTAPKAPQQLCAAADWVRMARRPRPRQYCWAVCPYERAPYRTERKPFSPNPRSMAYHPQKHERRPEGRRSLTARSANQPISIISKSALPTPQSGQSQSAGTSSQRVPGAIPSSGQPWLSS